MSNNRADVLIHLDESLDDQAIHAVEKELGTLNGVYSACVSDRARHLLLVDYDPADTSAQLLLGQVQQRGLHAELVGL
jgi:hypothetical protein